MTKRRAMWAMILLLVAGGLWWLLREKSGGRGVAPRKPGRAGAGRFDLRERLGLRPGQRLVTAISGTVRDEHGNAVSSAVVCTWPKSRDLASEDAKDPSCVVTDRAGAYLLARLVPARYRLHASAERHLPALYEAADSTPFLDLKLGEHRTGVDFVLRGGGVAMHGVVRDIGGGGIPQAFVRVRSEGGWRSAAAYTRTDDDGRFTAWVGKGNVSAMAIADGYAPGHQSGSAPGRLLELRLTPESILAGRVVEAGTDRRVPRVLVTVRGAWREGNGRSHGSAFTDEQGRFRITRLGPGRYKPVVRGLGYFGMAPTAVRLDLGQVKDDVVIEVYPAFRVTGRVVDDKGKPCVDGSVSLHGKTRGGSLRSQTDAAGGVDLQGVVPGTYRVRVRCRDLVPADRYPELTVKDRDLLDQRWIVRRGETLQGVVVTSTGAPVAGAWVRAQPRDGKVRTKRTYGREQSDRRGRFEMKGLRAATYEVTVDTRDAFYQPDPVKVEVRTGVAAKVRLVVEQGGTVRGKVVDEYGKPVAGVTVRAAGRKRWDSVRRDAHTRDDGTFELTGIRPGEVRVAAYKQRWTKLRGPGATDDDVHGETVTVKPGEVVEVRLVVASQTETIRGRVVDARGDPVTDAFVDAERESDSAGASARQAQRSLRKAWGRHPELTDLEGSFALRDLAEGTYTVRAYRRGGGEAVVEHVRVGTSVTLTLRATGSVSGTLEVRGATTPDHFSILVQNLRGGFHRREKFYRSDGRWKIEDVPPGDYIVKATAAQGTAKAEVTLKAGEHRVGLRLHLEGRATLTGRVVALVTGDPVPGMRVYVKPVHGGDWSSYQYYGNDPQRRNITDSDGRFTIEQAPAGQVYVSVFPQTWATATHTFARVVVYARGGETTDVGTIKVPRRRVGHRERRGDIGYHTKRHPPGTDPDDLRVVVSYVRPEGPADAAGLEPGDEIVTVGGVSVTGRAYYSYWAMIYLPAGSTLRLGLKGGRSVAIQVGEAQ